MTTTPITTHAQQAVTRLVAECHLMEMYYADAERIVQDAIDAGIKAKLAEIQAKIDNETVEERANRVFEHIFGGTVAKWLVQAVDQIHEGTFENGD